MNEINNLSWRTKAILFLLFASLLTANLVLLKKLDEHVSIGNRFTYADGVALYHLHETEKLESVEEIMKIYKGKHTDFKDFLIIHHK